MAYYDDEKRNRSSYIPAANGTVISGMGSNFYTGSMNRPVAEFGSPAGKPFRGTDLDTYQTPSGGIARVKAGGRVPVGWEKINTGITMPQAAAAYSRGYGAPSPAIVNTPTGQYLNKGGVMAPVETLSGTNFNLYSPNYRPPVTNMATRILSSLGMVSDLYRRFRNAGQAYKGFAPDYFAP